LTHGTLEVVHTFEKGVIRKRRSKVVHWTNSLRFVKIGVGQKRVESRATSIIITKGLWIIELGVRPCLLDTCDQLHSYFFTQPISGHAVYVVPLSGYIFHADQG
jgi:hypothetical protein